MRSCWFPPSPAAKHWKTLIFAGSFRLLALVRRDKFLRWPDFHLRPAEKDQLKTYQIFIFISSRAAAYSHDCLAVVCLLPCLSSVHLDLLACTQGFSITVSEKRVLENRIFASAAKSCRLSFCSLTVKTNPFAGAPEEPPGLIVRISPKQQFQPPLAAAQSSQRRLSR
jgi:hypothetical protein